MSRQAKATLKAGQMRPVQHRRLELRGEAKLKVAVQYVRKYAATETMQLAVSCVMNGYTLSASTCR